MAMKSIVNTSSKHTERGGLTVLDGHFPGTPVGIGSVPFQRTLLPQLAEVLVVVTVGSPMATHGREGESSMRSNHFLCVCVCG
jgi:hypothetical protein